MIRMIRNTLLWKFYERRTEVEKVLILCFIFSELMVTARLIISREIFFVFMGWNLFLGFVPYYISKKLETKPGWIENRWKFLAVFISWLLFIPNSFYIITDLFHLHQSDAMPRWFDLTLIFSFAWNGLMLGILSVRQMEKIVLNCYRLRYEFIFLFPVMWLIGLGVYICRYMRFNSWDLIANPFNLLSDIGYMFIHPFRNFSEWAMVGCFSVFITIMYISVKRLGKVI